KGQEAASVLLPRPEDENKLWTLMVAAAAGKFVRILDILWTQTHAVVFFIDWEKTRGKLLERGNEKASYAPVSVWRTLFVANEWNEIQSGRLVNIEFTLMALLFLLNGLGVVYLAKPQAESDLSAGETVW